MSSKKINIDEAESLAKNLTKKNQEEIDQLDQKIKTKVLEIALEKVPDSIKEAYSKDYEKNFICSSKCLRVRYVGVAYDWVTISERVPVNGESSDFHITEKENEILGPMFREKNKLKTDHRALKRDLIKAFRKLGSFKRIIAEFPKASEFLNDDSLQSLPAISFASLKSRIK